MRYFHRTSVPIDAVLAAADEYFGARMATAVSDAHRRAYDGPSGHVEVGVRADGGHYTLITVSTDRVGESEVDKLAKRFLSTVHQAVHAAHSIRGAY